ncbi:hypothetical protein SLS58_011040 [Diplodia intermedia]|uniref:Uncharacterized protein n=1 Tax=Diplodia intermedia TaxID=856260 RepID=A0ABR3T350_9PEZI
MPDTPAGRKLRSSARNTGDFNNMESASTPARPESDSPAPPRALRSSMRSSMRNSSDNTASSTPAATATSGSASAPATVTRALHSSSRQVEQLKTPTASGTKKSKAAVTPANSKTSGQSPSPSGSNAKATSAAATSSGQRTSSRLAAMQSAAVEEEEPDTPAAAAAAATKDNKAGKRSKHAPAANSTKTTAAAAAAFPAQRTSSRLATMQSATEPNTPSTVDGNAGKRIKATPTTTGNARATPATFPLRVSSRLAGFPADAGGELSTPTASGAGRKEAAVATSPAGIEATTPAAAPGSTGNLGASSRVAGLAAETGNEPAADGDAGQSTPTLSGADEKDDDKIPTPFVDTTRATPAGRNGNRRASDRIRELASAVESTGTEETDEEATAAASAGNTSTNAPNSDENALHPAGATTANTTRRSNNHDNDDQPPAPRRSSNRLLHHPTTTTTTTPVKNNKGNDDDTHGPVEDSSSQPRKRRRRRSSAAAATSSSASATKKAKPDTTTTTTNTITTITTDNDDDDAADDTNKTPLAPPTWPRPAFPHNDLHKWLVIGDQRDDFAHAYHASAASTTARRNAGRAGGPGDYDHEAVLVPRSERFLHAFSKTQLRRAAGSLRRMCEAAAGVRGVVGGELEGLGGAVSVGGGGGEEGGEEDEEEEDVGVDGDEDVVVREEGDDAGGADEAADEMECEGGEEEVANDVVMSDADAVDEGGSGDGVGDAAGPPATAGGEAKATTTDADRSGGTAGARDISASIHGVTYSFKHPSQLKAARTAYFAAKAVPGTTEDQAHAAAKEAADAILTRLATGVKVRDKAATGVGGGGGGRGVSVVRMGPSSSAAFSPAAATAAGESGGSSTNKGPRRRRSSSSSSQMIAQRSGSAASSSSRAIAGGKDKQRRRHADGDGDVDMTDPFVVDKHHDDVDGDGGDGKVDETDRRHNANDDASNDNIAVGNAVDTVAPGGGGAVLTRQWWQRGLPPSAEALRKVHQMRPIAKMGAAQLRGEIMRKCALRERLVADGERLRALVVEARRKKEEETRVGGVEEMAGGGAVVTVVEDTRENDGEDMSEGDADGPSAQLRGDMVTREEGNTDGELLAESVVAGEGVGGDEDGMDVD